METFFIKKFVKKINYFLEVYKLVLRLFNIYQMEQKPFLNHYYYNYNINNNDYDNFSNYSNDMNYNHNPFIYNSFDFMNENKVDFENDKNDFQNNKLNWDFQKENDFVNNENKVDQATTKFTDKFLGNKRNSPKNYSSRKKVVKKPKKEKEIYIEINNGGKSKMGRKKKNDSNKGAHSKSTPDNIMRKIKSNFFVFIHNLLNKSLKNKDIKFLKLGSKINKELKRDFNLKLLNRTIRDIYENTEITKKLRKLTKINSNINKEIISKIYEENIEEQTIKILNLTYFELFQMFRSKIKSLSLELEIKKNEISLLNTDEFSDINIFFTKIANEEMKNNESQKNIDYYVNKVEELCIDYENWFANKKGRNRKKNNNN